MIIGFDGFIVRFFPLLFIGFNIALNINRKTTKQTRKFTGIRARLETHFGHENLSNFITFIAPAFLDVL